MGDYEVMIIEHIIRRSFRTIILNITYLRFQNAKKEEKSADFSSKAGLCINISNPFLKDYEAVIFFVVYMMKKYTLCLSIIFVKSAVTL